MDGANSASSSLLSSRHPERKQPYLPGFREIRLLEYPHGESTYCRILVRYRSRGKFRTTVGGPRSRRPGSTPRGSPGWSTPSPREPHAARRRRRVKTRTRDRTQVVSQTWPWPAGHGFGGRRAMHVVPHGHPARMPSTWARVRSPAACFAGFSDRSFWMLSSFQRGAGSRSAPATVNSDQSGSPASKPRRNRRSAPAGLAMARPTACLHRCCSGGV